MFFLAIDKIRGWFENNCCLCLGNMKWAFEMHLNSGKIFRDDHVENRRERNWLLAEYLDDLLPS